MSTESTPSGSPVHVEPLHNPTHAAKVIVPQAPLGNATNGPISQVPGMGAKALLAKRMAKTNSKFVSPTDKIVTPCSQKISAAKKKHFTKSSKPMQQLFASSTPEENETTTSDEENIPPASMESNGTAIAEATAAEEAEDNDVQMDVVADESKPTKLQPDEENPF